MSTATARNTNRNSDFQRIDNIEKYLGVPIVHQRITKQTCCYLIEKVQKKLAGWKANNLSLTGRITLCKSVLTIISFYTMQLTVLPKRICYDTKKICRKFIWGLEAGRGKMHHINWKTICKSKIEVRLGLKKMHHMNMSFVMKLAWGVMFESDSL